MSFPSVKETATPGLFAYNICGTTFHLDKKYAPLKHVGYGSYGVLCAAKDTSRSDETLVVIERVENAFAHVSEMRALLVELTLSQSLPHPNILSILEVLQAKDAPNDLYLVQERMAVDLRESKRSNPLDKRHTQVLAYQVLLALSQLHAVGIAHGEVRPSNLLINEEFDVKLSKNGRAVQAGATPSAPVAHLEQPLWYYAPEVLGGKSGYSPAGDVWALGIVLLETLARKHFFKGRAAPDVLASLHAVLGEGDANPTAQQVEAAVRLLVPDIDADMLDLLLALLKFTPAERISAADALKHKVFASVANSFEAIPAPAPFTLPALKDEAALKDAILAHVKRHMPEP